MEVNILFLGGAKRVSLAERFVSAGSRTGVNLRIFSYELGEDVPISAVGTIVVGLRWNHPHVLDHIAATVRDRRIHVLLPFVDPATILAAQLKAELRGCLIPVSPEPVCRRFFDKLWAHEWFLSHGFDVPVFDGRFPAIAKPVLGSASNGVRILSGESESRLFFESHRANDYLLQRYVTGREYTVDCYIAQDGRTVAVIPRQRLVVAAGEVIKTRTIHRPDMVAICRQIIGRACLRGPINIQFIEDERSGRLYLMEVNPRFGGGVIASIEAGADMPLYVLNEYLGRENVPLERWDENLLMMRANREFFRDAADH
jgi:carbamoyl-phosphate synthase large subunit